MGLVEVSMSTVMVESSLSTVVVTAMERCVCMIMAGR